MDTINLEVYDQVRWSNGWDIERLIVISEILRKIALLVNVKSGFHEKFSKVKHDNIGIH